ncbi:hypothetical protein LZZ98_04745 [Acinetobacter sp. SM34]|uniref:hypothetical protein n=1 Tax=Acinetobacter sp. SM34 TaxID=1301620 RepID=UPI001EDBED27|nr:hypothetical protein [Acinetobacter sp. SM34]MCG2607846.1 hypothetical protein [Acinetobacter sp. SM34]
MTNMINKTVRIQEVDKLKTELIIQTVQHLLMLKSNQFDLSTEKNIEYAANCILDDLLQQKIQNGEIQVIEQDNSSGVMQ